MTNHKNVHIIKEYIPADHQLPTIEKKGRKLLPKFETTIIYQSFKTEQEKEMEQ